MKKQSEIKVINFKEERRLRKNVKKNRYLEYNVDFSKFYSTLKKIEEKKE